MTTPEPVSSVPLAQPDPRLLVRWFVQYNPMFTASALCVLGGVLLTSKAMGPGADVGLTGVLELYQWLVIGVAALLYRRLLERRPAAILGIISLVFLVDPTLQLGALAASERTWATLAWVASFAAKWSALAWAFRLRFSTSARALPVVVAALVAALPHAKVLGVDDATLPAALAVLVFAVGLVTMWATPRVESRQALGEPGQVMFPRIVRSSVFIGVAGVAYQMGNVVLAIGPGALLPAAGAAVLVATVRARTEAGVWALGVVGMLLASAGGMGAHFGVPLASLALLLASWKHPPRIFVGGVMLAVATAALSSRGAWTEALLVIGAVATVALAFVLVKRRAWSAVPALAVLHGKWLASFAMAQEGGAWGVALVVAGFVLLPAGVVMHRRLSGMLAVDEMARVQQASPDGPATSAAMGTSIA